MFKLLSLFILYYGVIYPVLAWSPTGGYSPGQVSCPAGSLLRPANSLLSEEINYVNDRLKLAKPALVDFVNRADKIDFDAGKLVSSSDIRIGLAFSGGGYRAMLVGAGEVAALDSRTSGSTEKGHLGGLLQASTYFSGLSGGSWLMASIYMQNFTTIDFLTSHPTIWDLTSFIDTDDYSDGGPIQEIILDPISKQRAGFPISITDIWGRILSQKLIDLPHGGPSLEWSDMIEWNWFQEREAPYPIFLANDRMPIENLVSSIASIFEITPYELGSFDPAVYAFTPLRWLGTNLTNGIPQDDCYSGFDNSGFLFGTSSSVFDLLMHDLLVNLGPRAPYLRDVLISILGTVTADVGIYQPNPFKGFLNPIEGKSAVTESDTLYLVDGGENRIVVPLQPLLYPDRDVDIVFAFDSNMDGTPYGWPNGSSLVNQYNRQFCVQSDPNNPITFPYVPDENTFINEQLASKPTFFGCKAGNLSTLGGHIPPLVVYMANRPYSYWSNTSVLKLTYSTEETLGMINNGYNIVTQLNSTRDSDWQSCVTCAIVQRELERRDEMPSPFCSHCFDKYCWDGTINNVQFKSAEDLNPKLLSKEIF